MTAVTVACDVCGKVIDDGVAHCPHEQGCGRDGCGCAAVTCPACCTECPAVTA